MHALQFPHEFSHRVSQSVRQRGFCILSGDDLSRLLAGCGEATDARLLALQEFAESCGARVETTPHLTMARFIPSNRGVSDAENRRVIRNDSY